MYLACANYLQISKILFLSFLFSCNQYSIALIYYIRFFSCVIDLAFSLRKVLAIHVTRTSLNDAIELHSKGLLGALPSTCYQGPL